jgi:hypothetical protein
VGRTLAWEPCSVGFVARWAVGDTGLPDLEHTHVVVFQLRDNLFDMDLEKLHGFELVTSKEHMPAEREPAASTCRCGIVCDQNRIAPFRVASRTKCRPNHGDSGRTCRRTWAIVGRTLVVAQG